MLWRTCSALSLEDGDVHTAHLLLRFPVLSETFIVDEIAGLLDRGVDVDVQAMAAGERAEAHPLVDEYGMIDRTHFWRVPPSTGRLVTGAMARLPGAVARLGPGALMMAAPPVRWWSLRALYGVKPVLRGGPYDVLHAHFGIAGLVGGRLKRAGVPGRLVVTFHGFDVTTFVAENGPEVYRDLFDFADLLLPISERWRERLIGWGADPERTVVHHMGVDVDRFEPAPPEPVDVAGGEDPLRIVTVGRLVEKKGHETALRALARLRRDRPQLDVRWTVIGSGPLEQDLHALASELEVQDLVTFLGRVRQDQLMQELRQSHVFLLPSRTARDGDQEGIPVSIMEAMAMAKPVVSTLHSGIPELVGDGTTGYVVPEDDEDALAARIADLADHPDKWASMGWAGRTVVEERFNLQILHDRLLGLYKEVT